MCVCVCVCVCVCGCGPLAAAIISSQMCVHTWTFCLCVDRCGNHMTCVTVCGICAILQVASFLNLTAATPEQKDKVRPLLHARLHVCVSAGENVHV